MNKKEIYEIRKEINGILGLHLEDEVAGVKIEDIFEDIMGCLKLENTISKGTFRDARREWESQFIRIEESYKKEVIEVYEELAYQENKIRDLRETIEANKVENKLEEKLSKALRGNKLLKRVLKDLLEEI